MWARNIHECIDPADYAHCICAVYSVGYSQPNRMRLTIPLIRDGEAECDCSSMVSYCLYMGGHIDENPWFHTAIEREWLCEHGYTMFPFGALELRRNDVLWRKGHTGLYIGNWRQAEAVRDENHQAGYEGTTPGDQDGGETIVRNVTEDWTWVLRRVCDFERDDDMTFMFTTDGKYSGHVYLYDGGNVHRVGNAQQQEAIKSACKKATNKDIPFFHLNGGSALIDCVSSDVL